MSNITINKKIYKVINSKIIFYKDYNLIIYFKLIIIRILSRATIKEISNSFKSLNIEEFLKDNKEK